MTIMMAKAWPFTQMLIVDAILLVPLHHVYEMLGMM